jgi:hypothetical protein
VKTPTRSSSEDQHSDTVSWCLPRNLRSCGPVAPACAFTVRRLEHFMREDSRRPAVDLLPLRPSLMGGRIREWKREGPPDEDGGSSSWTHS